MRHVSLIAAMTVLMLTSWIMSVSASQDDGSTVTITAPHNGDTVHNPVTLTYELHKGAHADHVHTYLDGKYQKGFQGTFVDLEPGAHEITVKVANHDHDVLAASDTITITVK